MTRAVSHPSAIKRVNAATRETFARHLAPPPILAVSQWADLYRRLAPESSSEPGQWRTNRAPYLRDILDAFSDPLVERVTVMAASQVGKSEILLNVTGYFMHQDPAPILLVEPTIGEAEQFSKTRVAPMIRESPVLRALVGDARSRDSGNTLLVKEFPGGHLTLAGANSPSGLAAKPIRVVLLDERDRHPPSAGTEGDPARLAITRTTTFPNRKIGEVSSPTLEGMSEIAKSYRVSDARIYEVPCEYCGSFQRLIWKQVRYDLKHPERAMYECVVCSTAIPEAKKLEMLRGGRWVPTRPSDNPRHIGFHISALYSPWISWGELAVERQAAEGDSTKMQPFMNMRLGEEWQEHGGGLAPGLIEARKEAYNAEVPTGVGYLMCGVDTQDDRLEYVVRGFGAGMESWLICFERIVGITAIPFGKAGSPWNALEALRLRHWTTESGKTIKIYAMAIDTQGHSADAAYDYVKPRFANKVYGTKALSASGAPLAPRKWSTNNKGRVKLFLIGSDTGKDMVYGSLRVSIPGPLYMHLPDPVPQEWAVQVTAEKKIRRQLPGGKWESRWILPMGARNEALDCEVLALVALRLSPLRSPDLGKEAERLAGPREPAPAPAPDPGDPDPSPAPPPPPTPSVPRRGGSMLRGWAR